ncbi:MAG: TlpA family protein disulfide reductase [Bernardetiaceae bacterium]|nr:TlpA family protein disulfide reductase [Bernardetiaceae bacterium]
MSNKYISLVIGCWSILFLCNACVSTETQTDSDTLPMGLWKAYFTHDDGVKIPFTLESFYSMGDTQIHFALINAKERIVLDSVIQSDNQFTIPMYIFDTEIQATYANGKLVGEWIRRSFGKESSLPFEAIYNQTRFEEAQPQTNFEGKWQVEFYQNNGDTTFAIGAFEQTPEGKLSGTFLTTTGDYRYLEGVAHRDTMKLSTFNGMSAYFFQAVAQDEQTIEGGFWSGKAAYKPWKARKNPDYKLPNPDSLTFLKKGYDKIKFEFPDLEGKLVSLDDAQFQDKVVIIQILGSWCPNCMDESLFLAPIYENYKSKGLEIIALAYEQQEDFERAAKLLSRMKKRLGMNYTVLFAGRAETSFASQTLPMLNRVMAFPTTIFIDKKGEVRRIHTGFAGKGTGEKYEEFAEETTRFIEKLLEE